MKRKGTIGCCVQEQQKYLLPVHLMTMAKNLHVLEFVQKLNAHFSLMYLPLQDMLHKRLCWLHTDEKAASILTIPKLVLTYRQNLFRIDIFWQFFGMSNSFAAILWVIYENYRYATVHMTRWGERVHYLVKHSLHERNRQRKIIISYLGKKSISNKNDS